MKSFKSLILINLVSLPLFAQEVEVPVKPARHFLSLGIGPSFASGKFPVLTVEQKANGTQTTHYNDVGYGKGFSMAIGYTLMFNKVLGLELNVNHLIGGKVKLDNIFYYSTPTSSYTIKQHNQLSAKIWKFELLLCGRLPYRKVLPYFKGGIIVSTGNKLKREITENVSYTGGGTGKGDYEILNTGGTSYGVKAAIGLDIPVSPGLMFFTELNYSALNHKWQKWEMKKFNINGNNQLNSLRPDEKSGDYKDSQPAEKINNVTFKTSLSSLSIMIGFKLALKRLKV